MPGSAVQDIVPNQEDRTELKSCLRTLNNKESDGEGSYQNLSKKSSNLKCILDNINFILRFKSQKEKRHGAGVKSRNIIPTKVNQQKTF